MMVRLVSDRTDRKDAWASVVRVMFSSNEFMYVE